MLLESNGIRAHSATVALAKDTMAKLIACEAERDRLIEEIARAREALAFYRDNWIADMIGDGGTPGLSHCFMRPTDELLHDGGDRARAHLATPSGPREGGEEGR